MRHLLRPLLLGPLAVYLAACASAGQRQQLFVAATNETVTTRLEAAYDGRGQHVIVENRSTEPIVVTSLQLRDCQNIKNRCEVQRLKVPVKPGQQLRLATVQVENQNLASNFRYSWTWQRASQAGEPASE